MTNEIALNESRFWDRLAEKYAKRPVADLPAYEKKLLMTRERLRPEMKLLEVGCGTGTTALIHAPYVSHIRATDLSPGMLAIARRKAQADGVDNVTFEAASIESLEAPDGAYDAILAMSLLHLLEDRRAALKKMHRMLAPGGRLFTSTTCMEDGHGWFRYVAPIARFFGRVPYVAMFSAETLLADFAEAGFEVEYQWRPKPKAAIFAILRHA